MTKVVIVIGNLITCHKLNDCNLSEIASISILFDEFVNYVLDNTKVTP